MPPELSFLETRVLGVLIEKERTVPDTYPLSLNALVSGCNQKTSRDPIVSASESEVRSALDSLRSMSLVIESSGGRVSRYAHNAERVLQVPRQATAILAVLMLRGAQTAGELRINTERLHSFADISSVEAFLQELASKPSGALVMELPRQPGSRENRWAHLLSGAPEVQAVAARSEEPRQGDGEVATLRASVERLEAEVVEIKALLAKIVSDLGAGR